MSDFLSPAWFEETNALLARAGATPIKSDEALRVVFHLDGAPNALAHAFTLTIAPEGVSVEAGDHLAAHTMLRLSFDDARRITRGELDGATALREGRLKVRGELNALVELLEWLSRAHPAASSD